MTVVEFVPAKHLDRLISQWRNLACNAVEPNPFYLPEFVKHAFAGSTQAGPSGVLVVRDRQASNDNAAIGIWPLSFALPKIRTVPNFVKGLHNPFMSCSVPLVRAGSERKAICGFLDWFEESIGSLGTLHLNEVGLDGAVWIEIQKVLEERQQSWSIVDEFERPVLDIQTSETNEAYLRRLSGKKRQSLRRKWRQLSKLGELKYARYTDSALPVAMREFLVMERGGWKGTAGTAMDLSDGTRSLACDVLSSRDYGATHVEALRLDDKPIAMNIHLAINGHAFFFKPAFDEMFASYSPGQLLHLKTIESLYCDRWAVQIDSAVVPNDQLGTIWRERKRIGRVLVATSEKAPRGLVHATSTTLRAYTKSRSVASRVYRRTRHHSIAVQQDMKTRTSASAK